MKRFNAICVAIVQNIGIIIIGMSVLAFFFPDCFAWMTKYTAIFLGVAMFGMGTSITTHAFKNILIHPKEVCIGCIAQYSVMPFIAWLLVTIFHLPPDLALGVILVGCCPGGTASNVITHIAGGNVALSVSMTITSTLIAPIVTPLLVFLLAGAWIDVSFIDMAISVLKVVLIPVVLGIIANKIMGQAAEKTQHIFPLVSSIAIILIIAGIIAANADKIFTCGAMIFIVVMLHNSTGLLVGLILGRIFKMPYESTTAVSVEIGLQNSGLAISLATMNFALNPLATLPGAIFSIWQNIAGSLFASYRRNALKHSNNQ